MILLACNNGNPSPTMKFALQLTATAKEVAEGLADWLNNSDTKNHGIEPGPLANMMTNTRTKIIDK